MTPLSPATRVRKHLEAALDELPQQYAELLDNVSFFIARAIMPRDRRRLKLGNDYTGSFDAPPESGVGTVDVAGRLTGQFKVHGPMAGVTFRF